MESSNNGNAFAYAAEGGLMTVPTGTATPVLEVQGVSKTFEGNRVLSDACLTIAPGEVHALLGENGSGKSTLIKILSGLYAPDPGGEVRIKGSELQLGSPAASADAGLRFVHQKLSIVPEFNAIENIGLEAGYIGRGSIDWEESAQRTCELLDRLEIEIDIWKPMGELRPVDRSAVAIARAVRDEGDPIQVVVLDEPTSSLPEAEVQILFRLIRDLASSGVGVLYVSHRLDEIFEIADRVSVLRDGVPVGTKPVEGLTREELVGMIVGGEAAAEYEDFVRAQSPSHRADQPLMKVEGLAAGRIRDLHLEIRPGEILGVSGIAGSGREEVARALFGAVARESGEIWLDGEALAPSSPPASLSSGLVLGLSNAQLSSAVGEFTIRENVTVASLPTFDGAFGMRRGAELASAEDWIRTLDIRPADPEALYGYLSGGNQQKTILARCLAARPRVLLVDEPTAGVDVGARRTIYEMLAAEAERGLAVIVCSSDAEDIVSLCDAAVVLRLGSVVARIERQSLTERDLLMASSGGARQIHSDVEVGEA